jgi:hypothetical protein
MAAISIGFRENGAIAIDLPAGGQKRVGFTAPAASVTVAIPDGPR